MQKILENPELALELKKKGFARANQFSWERTAQETIKVYEKVLGKEI
jgi:glycosyltransferase involved in cell wall biosynthesis